MDDLPEESMEKYPPPWGAYDWAEYDQDDFDEYVRSKWLTARLKITK